MTPSGQEFALENINRRETSVIIRKTGVDTLVQRNGGGAPVAVEITDAVKAALLELWGHPASDAPQIAGAPVSPDQTEAVSPSEPLRRKPGRPPR